MNSLFGIDMNTNRSDVNRKLRGFSMVGELSMLEMVHLLQIVSEQLQYGGVFVGWGRTAKSLEQLSRMIVKN